MSRMRSLCISLIVAVSCPATASETVTAEPDGSSYHFVSHYKVHIDAPAGDVWPRLIDIGSWMYEFDLAPVSGTPGEEGDVRRLYAGADYLIEITKVVPGELLVFANLPAETDGERSTGVAIIVVAEANGTTTVSLTMSRRYAWSGTGSNPGRAARESAEFQERTRAMWQDRFLARLKSLVEDAQSPGVDRVDACDTRYLFGTCVEYTLSELGEWYREHVASACAQNRRGELTGRYVQDSRCPAENRVARCEDIVEDSAERYEYDKHYYVGTADRYSWDPKNVRVTCDNVSGRFVSE